MSGQNLSIRGDITQRTLLPLNPVIVLGGYDIIVQMNKRLDSELRKYNRRLKSLSSPIFLRGRHVVDKREYHGRYFYKKVWDEEQGKIREVYIGLTVPEDDDDIPDGGFPPAPVDPLIGFEYQILYNNIICSRQIYDKFFKIFKGKDILVLLLKTG